MQKGFLSVINACLNSNHDANRFHEKVLKTATNNGKDW